jgi:cytochrome P450
MHKDDLRFLPRSFKMIEDPHSYYHKLRKEAPVYWSEDSNCWVLTRYDDVNTMLKDPRFGRGTTYRIVAKDDESMNDVEQLRFNLLPFKDGTEHDRIRSAMNALFYKRITKLEPQIQTLADTLLDKIEHQASFDLIADYAYPLSVGVISYLLGIPSSDQDIFKKYSPHFSALLVPKKTPADIALALTLITELKDYFNALIESNKKVKQDNLISDMLHENRPTSSLTDSEVLVMPIFLIFAGHETTMNMIGNGMLELFHQPAQLFRMIHEPEHLSSAIEELLRITSTNSALYRIAFENVEIGGKVIKKGEEVVAILAAANRDPERFPNPDEINITRKDGTHISFGAGIHHCMGATLGRIEAKIGYETLLRRIPNISLAKEPEWKESFLFRGLRSLIVYT